jgi:hypothetical protein
MTHRARIAILVVAVVALAVAFILVNGSGSSDDKTSEPSVAVIKVVDAKPQGGVKRLIFTKGQTINFTVQSDTTDEIHFHGYDVHKDVKAGESVTFSVPAKIEGRFVVELEDHATQIAEVEVDPS